MRIFRSPTFWTLVILAVAVIASRLILEVVW